MDELVEQVLAEGADAVCYKPFDVPGLLDTLEQLAERATGGWATARMSPWTPAPLDILVIEDDADTRANLRDILELDDHRVEDGRLGRRGPGPGRLGVVRGDHPRPQAPRRDGRRAPAPAQGGWPPTRPSSS